MRSIKCLALVAAMASTPALAVPSPSTTIFGMEAGKPIPYPECEGWALSDVICYKRWNIKGRLWDEAGITFPAKQVPEAMSSPVMSVKTVDGKIVGYEYDTIGLSTQESDLAILTKKFGEPTDVEVREVSNLAGGKFEAILARWQFSDLHVTFDSIARDFAGGRVEIYTPEGLRLFHKWLEDMEASRTQF